MATGQGGEKVLQPSYRVARLFLSSLSAFTKTLRAKFST